MLHALCYMLHDKNMENQTQTTTDKSIHGPKALFWFLTLFFTLGITAFNTGNIWFQFINKWVPQEVSYGFVRQAFSQGTLKLAIASIIIATPLFFLFTILVRRAFKNSNLDPKNKVRSWVTYIILFITIAIAIGDLITTVFRVLDGDFTARFLLKSLSILTIVGWIFTYYWLELKSGNALTSSNLPRIMGIVTAVVIGLSFIGSFFLVDSPAVARTKAFDRTRENNLVEIRFAIDNYYREFEKLPENFDELTDFQAFLPQTDPQTGAEYEYRIIDDQNFELCAEFKTSNKDLAKDEFREFGPNQFVHDVGKTCFTRKVLDSIEKPLRPIRVN